MLPYLKLFRLFLFPKSHFHPLCILSYVQRSTRTTFTHMMETYLLFKLYSVAQTPGTVVAIEAHPDSFTLTSNLDISSVINATALVKPLTSECIFIGLFLCLTLRLVTLKMTTAPPSIAAMGQWSPFCSIIFSLSSINLCNTARVTDPNNRMPNSRN